MLEEAEGWQTETTAVKRYGSSCIAQQPLIIGYGVAVRAFDMKFGCLRYWGKSSPLLKQQLYFAHLTVDSHIHPGSMVILVPLSFPQTHSGGNF